MYENRAAVVVSRPSGLLVDECVDPIQKQDEGGRNAEADAYYGMGARLCSLQESHDAGNETDDNENRPDVEEGDGDSLRR